MTGTFVQVRVGPERYALSVQAVREVAPLGDVMRMPGAPARVLGVRNFHGAAVAVVDLGAVAGSERDGRSGVVVVVEDGARRAALVVDEVIDVGPVSPTSEPAPAGGLIAGPALVEGELIGILDHAALLDAAAWEGAA